MCSNWANLRAACTLSVARIYHAATGVLFVRREDPNWQFLLTKKKCKYPCSRSGKHKPAALSVDRVTEVAQQAVTFSEKISMFPFRKGKAAAISRGPSDRNSPTGSSFQRKHLSGFSFVEAQTRRNLCRSRYSSSPTGR